MGDCPLCKRPLGGQVNEHHWIPKCKGGAKVPPSSMHRICHDKLHSLFTEKELATKYNTPEAAMGVKEVRDFVAWVNTKPVEFYTSNRQHRRKR